MLVSFFFTLNVSMKDIPPVLASSTCSTSKELYIIYYIPLVK